jgi:hypothetical protein
LSDWDDYVQATYREVVGEADRAGISRKEATDEVLARLDTDVSAARVQAPDWRETVPATVNRIDKAEGRRADALLREIAIGDPFEGWEDDPAHPVVVILGNGLRKSFRHVTLQDIQSMDELRYENARTAANAYDDYRRNVTRPWSAVLARHATVGEALDAGDVPTLDELDGGD